MTQFFYCILGLGVHVKNMHDSCIGTHVAVWFADFLPFTYIWHFSPCYLSPTPHPLLSLPYSPKQTPGCSAPLPVSMHSHCSTPTYEWEHVVFHFLFLCQFAENDGLQIPPCPYKGHKFIIFDGCIIFHGVYVPHFPCSVYHRWAFQLVPGLCYYKYCNEHSCACVLYRRTIYNPLDIYPVIGSLGQMEFLLLRPWEITTLSSTMVELIYTPTSSVKLFLFLHILSSICCLQIF